MQEITIPGVYKKGNKLFTVNPSNCKGIKVYGEYIIKQKDVEYRTWNPYRSKLAALIQKGYIPEKITSSSEILYLGAATGTTVSHISDIISDGIIYAIEHSPIAAKKLLELSIKRKNIIPILSNANHPEKYSVIVPPVDFIYQDISQRNQAEIFIKNINKYLKPDAEAIIMVKARSIDVSIDPKEAFKNVEESLKNAQFKIIKTVNLSPFEKDHAAIIITI
jgi:fibrillarin-like pre-rRNA processing protein